MISLRMKKFVATLLISIALIPGTEIPAKGRPIKVVVKIVNGNSHQLRNVNHNHKFCGRKQNKRGHLTALPHIPTARNHAPISSVARGIAPVHATIHQPQSKAFGSISVELGFSPVQGTPSCNAREKIYAMREAISKVITNGYQNGAGVFTNANGEASYIVTTSASSNPHLTIEVYNHMRGYNLTPKENGRLKAPLLQSMRAFQNLPKTADGKAVNLRIKNVVLITIFADGSANRYYNAQNIHTLLRVNKPIKSAVLVLDCNESINQLNHVKSTLHTNIGLDRHAKNIFKVKNSRSSFYHVTLFKLGAVSTKDYKTEKGRSCNIEPGNGFKALANILHLAQASFGGRSSISLPFTEVCLNTMAPRQNMHTYGMGQIKCVTYHRPATRYYATGYMARYNIMNGNEIRHHH